MTEAEWLASENPAMMLAWRIDLGRQSQSGVPTYTAPSARKLRLFACACYRGHYDDAGSLRLAGLAEKVADGAMSIEECHAAGAADGWIVLLPAATDAATRSIHYVQRRHAAALLRDVVGNPFRPVTLPYVGAKGTVHCRPGDPAKLDADATCPWITPTVVALARAAYDERPGRACLECDIAVKQAQDAAKRVSHSTAVAILAAAAHCKGCRGTGRVEDGTLCPDRLAVLSDPLEEAGCDDDVILSHLRGPGPHVRGCWALDLLLGNA